MTRPDGSHDPRNPRTLGPAEALDRLEAGPRAGRVYRDPTWAAEPADPWPPLADLRRALGAYRTRPDTSGHTAIEYGDRLATAAQTFLAALDGPPA
jgi:hypothetical protein